MSERRSVTREDILHALYSCGYPDASPKAAERIFDALPAIPASDLPASGRPTRDEMLLGADPTEEWVADAWAERADPPASGDEPNWRAERTGNCPCGGQCHHGDRIEWCSESCREAAHRTPPASETVEAAWRGLIEAIDRPHAVTTVAFYRPRIEAAIRAAALDEARAAVQDTRRRLTSGPRQDATDVHIAWALGEALAAIDALREGER